MKHGAAMLCNDGAVYLQSNVQEVATFTLACFSEVLGGTKDHRMRTVGSTAPCMEVDSSADVLSALGLMSSSDGTPAQVESESECISKLKGRGVFRWCLRKRS